MKNALDEFILVFSNSWRTQVSLYSGAIIATILLLVGAHSIGQLELSGPMAPLTGAVREFLVHHYVEGAVSILVLAVTEASRHFVRDRRRLLER
jgi:hypothetical protein